MKGNLSPLFEVLGLEDKKKVRSATLFVFTLTICDMETVSQDIFFRVFPLPCYKDLVGYLPSGEERCHAGILVCQHNTVRPKCIMQISKDIFHGPKSGTNQFRGPKCQQDANIGPT